LLINSVEHRNRVFKVLKNCSFYVSQVSRMKSRAHQAGL